MKAHTNGLHLNPQEKAVWCVERNRGWKLFAQINIRLLEILVKYMLIYLNGTVLAVPALSL